MKDPPTEGLYIRQALPDGSMVLNVTVGLERANCLPRKLVKWESSEEIT